MRLRPTSLRRSAASPQYCAAAAGLRPRSLCLGESLQLAGKCPSPLQVGTQSLSVHFASIALTYGDVQTVITGRLRFGGRMGVNVGSGAQVGVPEQLLDEFQVSCLLVDDRGGR